MLFGVIHSPAESAIFSESTTAAGISRTGNTFGVSWGDFDGDGDLDAFLTNHFIEPSLYINNGDGSFTDIAASQPLMSGALDQHGAAWADYDNDGDQDLLIVNGGRDAGTAFFVNDGKNLVFQDTAITGLVWGWHDRTPTWLDANNDGLLDVVIANVVHKDPAYTSPFFIQKQDNTFVLGQNFGLGGAWVSLLHNPLTPNPPMLLFNTGNLFEYDAGSWTNKTPTYFPPGIPVVAGSEYAYADVNNDGILDLYVIREGVREQVKLDTNSFSTAYRSVANELSGFDIQTSGNLTVYFGLSITRKQFLLGVNEAPVDAGDKFAPVLLDPNDPRVLGEPAIVLGDPAVWTWYTPETQTWHFRVGKATGTRLVEFHVLSDAPISNATTQNIPWADSGAKNYLYLGDGSGGFLPDDGKSGLSFVGPTRSGAFGDFDNDGDLDLYLVNRNAVDNLPNQLFLNDGNGIFTPVLDAGGAAGSMSGSGESASIADFDNDGDLDIFLTNGRSDLRMPYPGPHQLFSNNGNSNHWLEIDLIGTISSRDAIGAFVTLTANGASQVRFQDGGIHAYGQHSPRLHFGLGSNQRVDRITIHWPSGIVQELIDIPADQIIQIHEPHTPTVSGAPNFKPGIDSGVYVWLDQTTGVYHLRALGGTGVHDYVIQVLSSAPLSSTIAVSLDNSLDSLDTFTYGFSFKCRVGGGVDGVDFSAPTNANILISVLKDGKPDTRVLKVGTTEKTPSPVGWIMDLKDIMPRKKPNPRTEKGIFIGKTSQSEVSILWTGNSVKNRAELKVLFPYSIAGQATPISFEASDSFLVNANQISVTSQVGFGKDELAIQNVSTGMMGITFKMDSTIPVFQSFNGPNRLHRPNAYWLQ